MVRHLIWLNLLSNLLKKIVLFYDSPVLYTSLGRTYFVSAFLWRCSFKYHSNFLLRGKNKETASANSCQPWIKTDGEGLDLESGTDGIWEGGMATVGDSVPVASHVNRDWVAQRSNCWNNGNGHLRFRSLIFRLLYCLIRLLSLISTIGNRNFTFL